MNNEIISQIEEQLKKGATREEIVTILAKNDWTLGEILEGLKTAEKTHPELAPKVTSMAPDGTLSSTPVNNPVPPPAFPKMSYNEAVDMGSMGNGGHVKISIDNPGDGSFSHKPLREKTPRKFSFKSLFVWLFYILVLAVILTAAGFVYYWVFISPPLPGTKAYDIYQFLMNFYNSNKQYVGL